MFNIHVIGAGPSGCVFAREAARLGLKVIVSEEHRRIGRPVQCSGLISKAGLDSLNVDYSPAIQNSIKGAFIYSSNGVELFVRGGDVKAHVVNRAILDELLAEAAESEGVKIRLGDRFKGEREGEVLVGADGVTSTVARMFGFPRIGNFVVGVQCDFTSANVEDVDNIMLFLSNKSFPGFFGWFIPLNEKMARVGMGASLGTMDIWMRFRRFIKHHPIVSPLLNNAKELSKVAGTIPISPRCKTVKKDILLIGDAAGHVKSTTGGGVVFGTEGAMLAARCVAESYVENRPLSEYELLWKKAFGRDLDLHGKIRSFLNSLSDEQIDTYLSLAKLLRMDSFLNLHGDMDRPTLMARVLEKGSSPLRLIVESILSDY